MTNVKQIQTTINGAVIFYTVSDDNDGASVNAAFVNAGFPELVPEPRTALASLKAALDSVFGGDRGKYEIMPVKKGSGAFNVVERTRNGDAGNIGDSWGKIHMIAEVNKDDTITLVGDRGEEQDVQVAFDKERGKLAGGVVARSIVKALVKLNAITLRDSGGIYWLPESKLETVDKLAEGLAKSGISGVTRIYVMRTAKDKAALDAVVDALTAEAAVDLSRLEDEINATGEEELGVRALRTRQSVVSAIRERLEEYEKILGVSLDEIKGYTERVDAHLASTILEAMGAEQKEFERAGATP